MTLRKPGNFLPALIAGAVLAGAVALPPFAATAQVDVLGGLRAWDIDGAVTSPVLSVSSSTTFVDPIVAARINPPLSDRWAALSCLDVGGFGVGSDLTWQAAVTAT